MKQYLLVLCSDLRSSHISCCRRTFLAFQDNRLIVCELSLGHLRNVNFKQPSQKSVFRQLFFAVASRHVLLTR